ncbi:MAG: hypothetical protein GXP62_18440 [Oligoflexia bacterium]|nr:hypothetical protein [Oligoflexia bacterium]
MTDVDGDGFGDADPPADVTAGTDCDDQHADTFPGAAVLDDAKACNTDADGDGFGDADPAQGVSAGTDCDDSDALVNPAATELCNGVDDDCNDQVDIDAVDIASWVPDADGDGWTQDIEPTLACTAPGADYQQASYLPDCDDSDASIHPGAQELSDDGIDQDCSGADLETTSSDKGCAVVPGLASTLWLAGLLGLALRRR